MGGLSRPRQPGLGGEVMLSAKVPSYLKCSSHKGKKEKLWDLLSSDMIRPPLGANRPMFRHKQRHGAQERMTERSL